MAVPTASGPRVLFTVLREFSIGVRKAGRRLTGGSEPVGLRRPTVRRLVKLLGRKRAVVIIGHKTSHVFKRYDIVDETEIAEVAPKLDEQARQRENAAPERRVQRFHKLGAVWVQLRRNTAISYSCIVCFQQAGVAELADAADSKSAAGHPAWGFNSPLQHQVISGHSSWRGGRWVWVGVDG